MEELLFGTGIAHSVLLFALVIAIGLYIARFKFKGISLGTTWILFVGLVFSHFGFLVNPTVLSFMKDFGLILFVFSIGLQVGPGFFQSFKHGGVMMNLFAVGFVVLGGLVTWGLSLVTDESLAVLTGVMSGAVTNTPGLGVAQQTLSEILLGRGVDAATVADTTAELASAYALTYPFAIIGAIFSIIILKSVLRVDIEKEKAIVEQAEVSDTQARRMHCEVTNPAIFGKKVKDVMAELSGKCVLTRVLRNGEITMPTSETVFHQGDRVLIVTSEHDVDSIRMIFGSEVPMHLEDWQKMDAHLVSRDLIITRSSLTGKTLRELNLRHNTGASVARIKRHEMDLVASPNIVLQMGDVLNVVGSETSLKEAAKVLGNNSEYLDRPNLIPIFLGIACGVVLGTIPFAIPGIPQPIKIGLAGGPLIVALFLGAFGHKWKITTYTTFSANLMIREIGICFFMASVGLGAGQTFVESLLNGGLWWILYGLMITMIPALVIGLVARFGFKLNFYQICGLVSGGNTSPVVLAFAQSSYGTNYTSVNYITVYPLTMFLRVLVAQLMILLAMS